MKLTPKQTQAYKLALSGTKQIITYGGAIRGGKTYWLLLTLISLCSKYPRSRWLVVRESLPTLKRTIFVTFNNLLFNGLQAFVKNWDRDTNTVTFVNGSQLIFMSESFSEDKELNRFKGLEINGAGCEEVNELQEDTFNKIIERSGSWNGALEEPPILILATCNPSRGWVKERVFDPWVQHKLPDSYAYIPARITDNPHLSKAYIENLKNLPERQYKTMVLGDWDALDLENLFLEEYSDAKNLVDNLVADKSLDLYLTFDFNVKSTCLVIQFDDDSIRVIKEYHIKGLQNLCFEIRKDFPGYFYIVNGDASGNSDNSANEIDYEIIKTQLDLSYNQFKVQNANPLHKQSYRQCNIIFKNYKVLIDRSCVGLRKDLLNVQVISKGSKVNIDKSNEELTHHLDPLRYHLFYMHMDKIKLLGLDEFINQ